MKTQIANSLLLIALGFLLGFLLFNKNDKQLSTGKVETEVIGQSIDTVYLQREPEVRIVTKMVPKPYYVEKTVTLNGNINGAQNLTQDKKNYRDTIAVSTGYSLFYDARVTGSLDSISLGYIDARPVTIIRETVTTQVTKYPRGLYAGASSDISVGLLYHKDKHIFSVDANLLNPNYRDLSKYRISYYRRLF
jgi:hypothetical protein